jgi:hypothetical protein
MSISRACKLAAALLFWAWAAVYAQNIEKTIMPGEVIKGHAKYEDECSKCHERFNKSAQPRLCMDCHKEIAVDVQRKAHLHGHLEDSTCRRCHTDHKGREARIVVLDKANFDHAATGLKLKGAHKKLIKEKCESCHKPKVKYRDAPVLCDGCHRKDDVHKGGLGKKCEECHNEQDWKTTTFDHDKTDFKLSGGHVETKCKECHVDGRYKETPTECYACHRKDDQKDGHNGRFNKRCDKCHTADAWDEPTFNHFEDTQYRLKGKHEKVECTKCHTTTLYVPPKTPTRCISCHRKDDEKKGHQGSLGDKCDSCHSEQEWKKTSFDHDKTDYPLTGKHKDARCDACHKSGLKPLPGEATRQKLSTRCIACHKDNDREKGHKGKFGEKCETCHGTTDWKKTDFDHLRDTQYALKGKHRDAKCTACHQGRLYVEKTATDCVSCHRKDDDKKGHRGSLGSRCQDCHTESGWKVERFDHNRSRFPLTGEHVRVECKKCHKDTMYRDTSGKCFTCHEKEDVHKRTLGERCETCHNTRTWKSWDFDHAKTRFRLDGAHSKAECKDCHKKPVREKPAVARNCLACHATDDIHEGSFGIQCERCHKATTWREVTRR